MSKPSKLSLLATALHILLAILFFKYDEWLYTYDLENLAIFILISLVIAALMLAIQSRKTLLGVLLIIANSICLVFGLFLWYFAVNYTFKV
ncbi:hypothetical protein SAMN05421786_101265 [Chryseobacterium ureilyticum]|uniref:Uncharacterized protein n=1 Tax=Chryseobacterium ureilyticum TaxID=373668 RepID=A0A1N7K6B1_9FLAO|nr:hypothetical protein [Chryseobacterium ureilyticum]SIS57099.1 hypothetical protein SAMN05421786_101265 [Chryseobacterium ureilyticum]